MNHRSIRKIAVLCAATALLPLLACAFTPSPTQPVLLDVLPARAELPMPESGWRFDESELTERIKRAFFETAQLPFDEPDEFLRPLIEQELGVHAAMENVALFKRTAQQTTASLKQALTQMEAWFPAQFGNAFAGGKNVRASLKASLEGGLDWKTALAFLRTCVMIGKPSKDTFLQALDLDITLAYDAVSATLDAEMHVSIPAFARAWAKSVDNTPNLVTGKLAYAYLLTVYDDAGRFQTYREPKDVKAHLSGITSPVAGNIRKTWFAGRDNGTRKHTGTDILAPEDTPIYSATAGTVSVINTGSGAGNYVVVTDAAGYEYHYYHMVRRTDFLREGDTVKAGSLIGHVGNTGNSSANHLHLTIIHPNGQYINPYPYLVAAAKRK